MALRLQTVSQNHESRPLPRDRLKNFGFLGRLTTIGISLRSLHNFNSDNMKCNHHQNRNRTESNNSATSMTTCSSSCASVHATSTARSSTSGIANSECSIGNMAICCENCRISLLSTFTSPSGPLNAMKWMQNECPKDVVPLILAYAGPQKIAAIGKTNRFWRELIDQEATWSRLCELLYKWKEGDEIPASWKKYYQCNPCVPVDYYSIHTAIRKATLSANEDFSEPRAIRVLLRPGRYHLRKAIAMYEDNTIKGNQSVSVTIETMSNSPNLADGGLGCHTTKSRLLSNKSKRKLKSSIKNLLRCRTVDVESDEEEEFDFSEELYASPLPSEEASESTSSGDREVNRATLVLSTRHFNEPLVRVTEGSFMMRNLILRHGSSGNDIWNGNAAIQIHPTLQSERSGPSPNVTLDCVDISSWSGRGVVNLDGGSLKMKNSHIHDCAATGVYVGGSESSATIERSDITNNGKGNKTSRRGIAPGHSGLYLESGNAWIVDCNISNNTLTGISAISPDSATLNLQDSDLISNGTFQLEMPAIGSIAHRNSVTTNNNLASSGMGRSRSMISLE